MSKKSRPQASSARAISTLSPGFKSAFQSTSSPLSYINEVPDFTSISDSNLVVAFKNLNKKDSTTKAKALEEIQAYLTSESSIEQSVLIAWSEVYPRTSIDNARRVRQLAHSVQGRFTAVAGKRIAPLLPKLVGSWLAGTFDNDTSVCKSANDALISAFTTPDKRGALWTLYEGPLLRYVEDTTTVQTKSTLSDERVTSADEADAKYARVVGSGLRIFSQLVQNDTRADITDELLEEKKIWELVVHNDPYLRRSVCQLAIVVTEKRSQSLNWSLISTYFLAKGLHANQIGSARKYTEALVAITRIKPEAWTTEYTAKTTITKRLQQFLRRGSQHGPAETWLAIESLLMRVPSSVWLDCTNEALSTLDSIKSSITQNSERANANAAWGVYVRLCLWAAPKLDAETKSGIIETRLMPLIAEFITRQGDQQWTITANAVKVCKAILDGALKLDLVDLVIRGWTEWYDTTIETMKLSLPASSKDFRGSQESVIAQGRRLFDLKRSSATNDEGIITHLAKADSRILAAATSLLETRNGNPYGAAAIVEMVVIQQDPEHRDDVLQQFLRANLSRLLDSPSAKYLSAVSIRYGNTNIIDTLLEQPNAYSSAALIHVLQNSSTSDLTPEALLTLERCVEDVEKPEIRAIAQTLLENSNMPEVQRAILTRIESGLNLQSPTESQSGAIEVLEQALAVSTARNVILADGTNERILSRLLLISESDLPTADGAAAVIAKLDLQDKSNLSSIPVLQEQFRGETEALSISTMIDLAVKVLQSDEHMSHELLPSKKQWQTALLPHLSTQRPSSLAITSPIQGVLHLLTPDVRNATDVSKEAGHEASDSSQLRHDVDGLSQIYRLTVYAVKLAEQDAIAKVDVDSREALQQSLPLALFLINEKLTCDAANNIWLHTNEELTVEAADILSYGNVLLRSWIAGDAEFTTQWLTQAHNLEGQSCTAYCQALAWYNVAMPFIDQSGPTPLMQEYEYVFHKIGRNGNIIRTSVLAAILQEHLQASPHGKQACNELVADITDGQNVVRSLILLNLLLQNGSKLLHHLPPQRIVFLLKNLVKGLSTEQSCVSQAEIMKLLTTILPLTADIYGEHWNEITSHIVSVWRSKAPLPVLHATFRLHSQLRQLSILEDVNEDLPTAMAESEADLADGLTNCLFLFEHHDAYIDQPRDIVAALLRRELKEIKPLARRHFYELLSSPVPAVQCAAVDVLSRTIPKQQEQLSVDIVLDNQPVSLPEGLGRLLQPGNPARQYMLAWNLLFEHFPSASYKLREAYTEVVKKQDIVNAMLEFICDALRMTSSRPLDPSRYDMQSSISEAADTGLGNIDHLVVRGYYYSLLYLPSLVKEWFLSQKKRVTNPLEAWTAKYVSSAIVERALTDASDWAVAQAHDEDGRGGVLTVKSSARASELVASIEIDPENPPIALVISLPASYPLESPAVISRTRVGVSEKNWTYWLRTFQIIIFSTGSIVEGLVAFRRNVQGALKGQSECAICYSIIGTDMQTPNKKCGTCKNTFHGACLFRWFKSSNSSSCPLCRNNFNYA